MAFARCVERNWVLVVWQCWLLYCVQLPGCCAYSLCSCGPCFGHLPQHDRITTVEAISVRIFSSFTVKSTHIVDVNDTHTCIYL